MAFGGVWLLFGGGFQLGRLGVGVQWKQQIVKLESQGENHQEKDKKGTEKKGGLKLCN